MAFSELFEENAYVATQYRGQVGVGHRAVATCDEPDQRRNLVRHDDLLEARLRSQPRSVPLVVGIAEAVQERDRDGAQPVGPRLGQFGQQRGLVERLEHHARRIDPLVRLDHAGVQRGRQPYRTREDVRPVLVADAQRVTEAACRHQQGRLALALEQRVRGYRRAEPHRFQPPAAARRAFEDVVDGANRRVARAPGVARQDLVRVEAPIGIECDDVGERTAAVDRESPGLSRTIGVHRGTFARCAQVRQTTGLCARATGR